MPIEESKLKDGILTLGTTPTTIDFSCQVINVRINSAYDDEGDAQETLCGEVLTPSRKRAGRSLAGTVIQDWTAATSIIKFLWEHDLEVMEFSFTPNELADTVTGTVQLEVPSESYGGDVNTRLTSDFEWQMKSEPLFTAPVVGTTATEPAAV